MTFIGEAVRDAFDPRKLFTGDPIPAEMTETAGKPAKEAAQ